VRSTGSSARRCGSPLAELRAVGGFDERFFMNSEEVDLQRRLRERGVPVVALRSPTVVHAGGGSSPSESRRRWLVEGQLAYADKWGSRRALQAALVAATGANLLVNTARRAVGRDVRPLEVARTEITLLRGRRGARPGPD
jgi:GT2 family glycosyltransferase